MKFIKYGWLAALPMIFTACQEDVLVKEQQQDKIYTLSATMDRGSAMSRAQIQLGNQNAESGETFIWNENDSFLEKNELNAFADKLRSQTKIPVMII